MKGATAVSINAVWLLLVSVSLADPTNLIYNGDFEAGDTGFYSAYTDHTYDPAFNRLDGGARYVVRYSWAEGHPNWEPYAFGDHTSGHGLMYLANGATDQRVVWSQDNISVVPGRDYTLSYFLGSGMGDTAPAQIEASINGQVLGTATQPTVLRSWSEISYRWNSGTSTTASVSLRDLTTAWGGNDFTLDDISLTPLVTLYLRDNQGLPLDGEDIKVQPAYGGSWGPVFAGVTETDGSFRCEMEPGYTKIRMTFNQASAEQTVTELSASGYTWTAVAVTVQVIDYQGQGITGVKVSQGGSMWVDHGYTDSAGEFSLYLFPDKTYKFRVSGSAVSNSSQTAWFPVPGPIQFQAGYVVSAGTAMRGSIGGSWVPYAPPGMHVFPGTYSFVFSAPTPSPQSVTVSAGAETDIP